MRVIAGSARGTRLGPVPKGTRPLSDRAREGLFSSLGARVPGSRVLDLYAGTGAIGIEALSRGATSAVFVDSAKSAVRAVEANLARAKLRGEVRRQDVSSFLGGRTQPFDIVFLDPPYDATEEEVVPALAALNDGWLASNWTVVLTRAARSYTPVIPVDWRIAKRLVYGDTVIVLYREV